MTNLHSYTKVTLEPIINKIWICPFCKREFLFFEVLDTEENTNHSLAPHLYLEHEKELTKYE